MSSVLVFFIVVCVFPYYYLCELFSNYAALVYFLLGTVSCSNWLSEDAHCRAQALIYFAVAKFGEAPTDGKTDLNPEGLTAAYGKWADALAQRLHAGGLSCKVMLRPVSHVSS